VTGRTGPASTTVAAVAIGLATAVVALGLSLRTDDLGRTAPVPAVTPSVPEAGADATIDLASALPATSGALAGQWAAGPGGATVTTAPASGGALLAIPLDGPPWATATVQGTAVDGWSVAFGVAGPSAYWAVTLRPTAGSVELIRVSGGQPATVASRPIPAGTTPDGPVEAVVRWQGRQVQVALAGAPLPTVTVPVGTDPSIGLLGRGAAAQPGAARWSSVAIEAGRPLGPAQLPPLLDARHVTADEARESLGG
jgi:hypothetical protein